MKKLEDSLSVRARNVLENHNLSLEEVSRMTKGEILSLRGCGINTFYEYEDALAGKGVFLPKEPGIPLFSKKDFDMGVLEIKYAIRPEWILVRAVTEEFAVIEYEDGQIYRLPVKELGRGVRVECNQKKCLRLPLESLHVGKCFKPKSFV